MMLLGRDLAEGVWNSGSLHSRALGRSTCARTGMPCSSSSPARSCGISSSKRGCVARPTMESSGAADESATLPWQHSLVERIEQELATLADADLERIAAIVDAMTGALPGGLTAWVRQLVDQERDRRIGKYYPLRPATDAIEDFEMPNCIAAAKRLRDHSIDLPLVARLDAVVDELEALR